MAKSNAERRAALRERDKQAGFIRNAQISCSFETKQKFIQFAESEGLTHDSAILTLLNKLKEDCND